MTKIPLTPRQRQVYDRLVELTDNGRQSHIGRVRVPGITGSTVRHTVTQCVLLGLIRSEPEGRDRRLTLLIGPEGVQTVRPEDVMGLRMTGRWLREDKLPEKDTGAFREALENAHPGQRFDALKMKQDLPFRGTFKPDARAL